MRDADSKIKVFKVEETKALPTPEGIMRPFLFTEKVSLIHLEIPAGTEITPHAHPRQGLLYCLKGEMEVFSGEEKFTVRRGTAVVVSAQAEVGVNNKSQDSAECLLISAPPTFVSTEELEARLKQYRK